MTNISGGHNGKSATVPGREDTGVVIQWGTNIGPPDHNKWAVILHFPETGEIAWYDSQKVTVID